MSFGFSVSDFLALAQLIFNVSKALSDSTGSQAKYQGFIQTLLSLLRTVNAAEEVALRCVAMLSVLWIFWEHCSWIVLRKRVGIRPLLIDKLSSILIPQDGAIAPEGFVLLPIVDPFINKGSTINMTINYQYHDQLS